MSPILSPAAIEIMSAELDVAVFNEAHRSGNTLEEFADRIAAIATGGNVLRQLGEVVDQMRQRAVDEHRRAERHWAASEAVKDEELAS